MLIVNKPVYDLVEVLWEQQPAVTEVQRSNASCARFSEQLVDDLSRHAPLTRPEVDMTPASFRIRTTLFDEIR